jgi:hypothetical protein
VAFAEVDLVVTVLPVELYFEAAEVNALRLRGVLLRLLDLVDHPGIEHFTLLGGWKNMNARAAIELRGVPHGAVQGAGSLQKPGIFMTHLLSSQRTAGGAALTGADARAAHAVHAV